MSRAILKVMSGAPVFPGTRVPVQTLLDYLEAGETINDFLEGFPSVTRSQVIAFLEEEGPRDRIRLVRVLLDECVDWRLASEIVGHDVVTAEFVGSVHRARRQRSCYLKYLRSGAFWPLAVGIRKPSALIM